LLGKRFSKVEQAAWEVTMYFQKNAWMNTEVMAHSAQKFCDHIKQQWGGKKVLLFCDNLSAHVAQETKQIYGNGNVFLYFLPPNVTESLQAIDAGYGRSMRCAIGRFLDKWLLDEDNLALWEDEKGMLAGDRRVLMSKLVALANDEVLKNDSVRIDCFQRTGMLMTLDGTDDDKIRPQGLTIPVVIPQGADLTADDDSFNRISADEIDTQNGWNDDADDDIREQDTGESFDEESDVIVEAQVENEEE
jgi:DDE superfamily endonuclease